MNLVPHPPRYLFFTGKGGVGKTSLSTATAIQLAGAPLPTVIIGTLPVVIALSANGRNAWRDGKLPWQRLLPSLQHDPSPPPSPTSP